MANAVEELKIGEDQDWNINEQERQENNPNDQNQQLFEDDDLAFTNMRAHLDNQPNIHNHRGG